MKVSGVNGQLELAGDLLLIKREGFLAKAAFFGKGEKAVKVDALSSIEFKQAGWLSNGFIHFVFSGSKTLDGNIDAAGKNENAVIFNKKQQADFQALHSELLQRMSR
ncbi:DUF4429 domain-containing protein [Pseudogulbenkiania ferrooxidans]|uniref:DUF4429 domain-containing protein n=1 Tax=Pseudogulbenkiania ferrooxidans 2002 TaxID=279714 RepID=B9YYU6_9NEIS|nr:DUF4429 domain-containing protein [Pseudogulbenkiania ferrooxidans]EEG10299.1 conserved hypothetical protein [Pseudogulbenkiania ferrooxidans 2002]